LFQYAPPNSYIDASKYTPKELAEYLQILDKDDALYNQFFEWKKHYYIASHDGIPLACDLCEQLHNPNWGVEKKVYEHFDEWLEGGCKKGWYAEPSK
jgi:alpha-1,3-fucosyltransferase